MLINSQNLKALNHGFSKVFNNQLSESKGQHKELATIIHTKSATMDYAWLGDFPQMREWVGDRQLKDLKAYTHTITKKKFELTIEVDRDDILGDNLGIVKPRIQSMASAAESHYDVLTFGLLEKNENCFDGKKFFATDHPVGSETFSNLGNKALSPTALKEARQEMRAITNEAGLPLRLIPNLLVVPPDLEFEAMEIVKKDYLKGGEQNILQGIVGVMVADHLTDPKAWYLIHNKQALRPIIMQIYEPITFTAMDREDDENVFMRDKFRYGVRAQHNAGYALWQMAYKSTGVA